MSEHEQETGKKEIRLGPLEWLLAAVFAAIILVAWLQVFCRYVLNSALGWGEELSVYLLVWLVFLGAAAAMRDCSHIRVEVIVTRFSKPWQKILHIAVSLLQAVFLTVMVWVGFRMVHLMSGTSSPALHLPVSYVSYAALPLTFLAGAIYALRDAWRVWRGVKLGE